MLLLHPPYHAYAQSALGSLVRLSLTQAVPHVVSAFTPMALGAAAGCLRARPGAAVSVRRVRRSSRVVASAASPWRLADAGIAPQFVRLAQDIEALWLSHGGMGALAPLPVEPRFVTADGGDAAERLRLENRFYATPLFRKCHLELASGGAGLSVLHCVMYPWPAHDLPLFSVDMVGFGVRSLRRLWAHAATPDAAPHAPQPRVTLAIADVCPSRDDLSLPRGYAVRALSKQHCACAETAWLARRALATLLYTCAA